MYKIKIVNHMIQSTVHRCLKLMQSRQAVIFVTTKYYTPQYWTYGYFHI